MANKKATVFQKINMMGGDETVCWPWMGATGGKHGRPYVRYEGKVRTAYSVVYELTTGDIVGTRLIRHKCDNPSCVNPNHLLLGTQMENLKDMSERGRGRSRVLSPEQIEKIRLSDKKPKELSAIFGVGGRHISRIKNQQS